MLNEYLDLVCSIVDITDVPTSEIHSRWIIPFWYDGVYVDRNGANKTLFDWLLDYTEGVSFMDYRNNTNQAISTIQSEVNTLESRKKKYSIILETGDESPPYISFFGK